LQRKSSSAGGSLGYLNRKVTKPWFDSWCGSASLYPWDQAVYSSWWPSLTKDMQTEPFCVGVVWQTQSIMVHTGENEIKFSLRAVRTNVNQSW